MADASSGVSGSSQNSSASAQQSQAANEAAEAQRAAEAAAAAAAVNATPTPALTTVEAAPVDLSVPMSALSQLNAMQVNTPALDFSSLTTLGGVPTNATYADVALSALATPTTTVEEFNAFSPAFSIDGFNAADIANTDISNVGINLGLSYTGSLDATMNARFGLDPANVTVSGSIGYSNDLSSFNLSATAGPFGSAAQPNYGATVKGSLDLGNLNAFDFSGTANFNAQGFQNGNVSLGLTRDFSENLSGYARGTVGFGRDGVSNVTGETGLNYNQGGTSLGLTGRGSVDTNTGAFTGYVGARVGIRF
ncbi:hypothetical protein [Lysobacter sp. Root690]|uniref:hypothetical protein n=1 Tax=Lysobacter sp. Root690 TaxID=1736588 RepID=UPI000701C15F|nr:hypothetical protein [Lysobacter sp. Root690]KRB02562.1 hypothetical protein ASD86_23930 [Lysobacter sp. Root690]